MFMVIRKNNDVIRLGEDIRIVIEQIKGELGHLGIEFRCRMRVLHRPPTKSFAKRISMCLPPVQIKILPWPIAGNHHSVKRRLYENFW